MLKKALYLCMAWVILNSANAQDYKIYKHVANNEYEENITIDGQYWSDPFWNGSVRVPKVSSSGNITLPTTDNTFDFAATYDSSYLYIVVNVNETYNYNNPLGWLHADSPNAPWEDDGVEIYIDPKNGNPLFQAIINHKGFNTPATLWTNSNYSTDGILFASAFNSGTKYIYQYQVEVAIPWSKLGINPESGLKLGLDIAVNDDDNGGARDGQIAWKGTANNWNSTANYGKVNLYAADYGIGYINPYVGAPVIDGEVLHDPAFNIAPWADINKQVINTSDNEANLRLTWDGSYLYVGIVVWDNQAYINTLFNDSPEIWNDDAIEIFIDPTNTKLPYFDPVLHRQILVQYSTAGTSPEVNIIGNSTGIITASQLVYSKIYLGGYSVEVAIPWSNLGITPTTGTYLGFDVSVDDDDNGAGRDSQIAWKGTADNWQNSSLWGTVLLNYDGFINNPSTARFDLNDHLTTTSTTITSAYPNPVTDQLNIQLAESATHLQILNANGKALVNESIDGMSNYTLSTSDWSNGLYLIKITNQYGTIETLKVAK